MKSHQKIPSGVRIPFWLDVLPHHSILWALPPTWLWVAPPGEGALAPLWRDTSQISGGRRLAGSWATTGERGMRAEGRTEAEPTALPGCSVTFISLSILVSVSRT